MSTPAWHEWRDRTLRLYIRVQPGARRSAVDGLHDGRLRIRLQARAVDGAANQALLRFLADAFAVRVQDVHLDHGAHARTKTVAIANPGALPDWFRDPGAAG